MNARDKVLEAERRIRAVIDGQTDQIVCPFCGLTSEPPQPLCCNYLAELVNAIVEHVEIKDRMEVCEHVIDRLHHMENANLSQKVFLN